MTDINLSLDDIIKKSKTLRTFNPRRKQGQNNATGRRNGVSGRAGGGKISGRQRFQNSRPRAAPVRYSPYKRGDVDSPWSHDLYEDDGFNLNSKRIDYDAGGTKTIISNLDFGVTDSDLEELFMEIGPLVTCEIHYDKSGRSLGSGNVIFEKRTDALRAINQYNGVPLDGRPMKIEIAASAPGRLIGSKRIGVPNNFRNRNAAAGGGGGGGGGGGPMRKRFGNNRGGGLGNNNRNRRNNAANISAEQLDAELDEYRTKGL